MQLMGHWLDAVQVTEMLFEVVKCIPFKQVCFE